MEGTNTVPKMLDLTLDDVSHGFAQGKFTSEDLTRKYLARVAEVNDKLAAVTELNSQAIDDARAADKGMASNGRLSLLHGVPIFVKENIATTDNMQTNCGSYCLLNSKPSNEAEVVTLLRKSGAVILGKTNMTEWANLRSNNSCGGWSALGGQTYGAYHEKHDPGGSSSGSAVAISVGLAMASIGTETDGSIVCPAGYNSVVGIKPSRGVVSSEGLVPGSPRADTPGIHARTVRDAAHVLKLITNKNALEDPVAECRPDAMYNRRVGVIRNVLEDGSYQSQQLDSYIRALRDAGCEVVDDIWIPSYDEFPEENFFTSLLREYAFGIKDYLRSLQENPAKCTNLEEIVSFLKEHREEQYPHFDVGRMERSIEAQKLSDEDYQDILNVLQEFSTSKGLPAALETNKLDAIIVPEAVEKCTSMAAAAGLPVVVVPGGYFPEDQPLKWNSKGNLILAGPGTPFGLQFIGAHEQDAKLVGLAYAFEQQTKFISSRLPIVLPKTELMQTG